MTYKMKAHPCRLFWRHRAVFSQLLVTLEDMEKTPRPLPNQETLSAGLLKNLETTDYGVFDKFT